MAAFTAQAYSNSEMLIVSDGEDVFDLLPEDDMRIRLIHLAETRNIGEKRNFGCSRALGEVICHWDDDDYSAPGRLHRQIEMLNESGLAVAGFHSMKFTDGENWWKYKGARNYSLGTALCYRREWWEANPFKPMPIGEDNEMVYAAQRAQQIVSEDAGELMYATIHDANTSPRMIPGEV
jgi:glycosyltransferase involved in cell wall biosynthesis